MDLPEVIAIRKQFLPQSKKHSVLPMSIFDYQWIETVLAHKTPVLLILEGVLMYFEEKEVRKFFDVICEKFDNTTTSVIFDMLLYKGVGRAKRHDTVGKTTNKPEFKWSLLQTAEMEQWHPKIHLNQEFYMSDCDTTKRFPCFYRMLMKIPHFYKSYNQIIYNPQNEMSQISKRNVQKNSRSRM